MREEEQEGRGREEKGRVVEVSVIRERSRKFANKLNKTKLGGHFHRIFRLTKPTPKCTKTNKIYDTALTPTTDPLQNYVFTETPNSLINYQNPQISYKYNKNAIITEHPPKHLETHQTHRRPLKW